KPRKLTRGHAGQQTCPLGLIQHVSSRSRAIAQRATIAAVSTAPPICARTKAGNCRIRSICAAAREQGWRSRPLTSKFRYAFLPPRNERILPRHTPLRETRFRNILAELDCFTAGQSTPPLRVEAA